MKKRLFALFAVALIGLASAKTTPVSPVDDGGAQTEGRARLWSG